MSKPRLLILHNIVAPYRLPLFDELEKEYDVEVLFCKKTTADRKWNVRTTGYKFSCTIMTSFSLGPLVFNPFILFHLLKRPADTYLLADNEENIPSTVPFILWATLRRKPVIIWNEHIERVAERKDPLAVRLFKAFERRYRRWLYARGTAFLSMSGRFTDRYLRNRGVPQDRIFTNTQIMPDSLLPKVTQKEMLPKPYLLYLGYFRPEKRIAALIRAFKQADTANMQMVIAGAGPEETALRELANGDPSVHFVGYANDARKATLMTEAAALVFPSQFEAWGLVVNESLHYGTPVLCSDRVAASSIIAPGKNGLVFGIQDDANLIACLERFCRNHNLQARMKQAVQSDSKDYLTSPRHGTTHFKQALQFVMTEDKL